MATASKVHLSAQQKPQYYVEGLTDASAQKASALLQENHERHHIYFNHEGFHNHIVHHLLTLFALNASPAELQKAYDVNVSYQRPAEPVKESIVKDMHDASRWEKYLGKEQYYHDFLVYYQQEIEAKGWETVLEEHVFAGTPRADDMLVRMFAGFLHPIIHLGFGVEFEQPAIIAEALAQAATHANWIGAVFDGCEKKADEKRKNGEKREKTIVQILDECRRNEKLVASAQFKDANKIRDGILKRAPEEMMELAAQYVVGEGREELEQCMAEMMNAAVYLTAAAQRPPHQVKFDFFYMHCVNSSIFFSAFLSPTSPLSASAQRRLLEWKIWNDIVMYVSRGSPQLLRAEIESYTPKQQEGSGMQGVIERVRRIEDDGHASKLVRAILHAERVCRDRGDEGKGMHVSGDMWSKVGHMAVDSVEAGEPEWVRSCGFEQAWEKVALREGEGAARL